MKELPCPLCGALVLCDDAKLEMHHKAPVCDGWNALMAERGGRPAGALMVTKQGTERVEPFSRTRGKR